MKSIERGWFGSSWALVVENKGKYLVKYINVLKVNLQCPSQVCQILEGVALGELRIISIS